jgi:DNA polymerase-3 subunit gamma/tau
MDVLEIDAASNTGIDNVRETIIDGININPARDRFKVFIVDEVHQLSKPAFNALLKTLEEPPKNVVFIMATTELHKVPDTILSRTQEFEFRTIPLQKIFDRLKIIADAEKINVSDEALREIARSGEGSMRDAQSNFDQVISFSGERIEVDDVVNALGLASVDMLTRVLDAVAENKPSASLAVVDELTSRGQDLRNFCRDLLGLFRDLLVTKVSSDAGLCETSMLSPDELTRRSKPFSESDLVRLFHSLADTENSLKDAAQPRFMLEIGLVKLCEMRRLASLESILDRLANLESSLANSVVPQKAAAAPESGISTPLSEKKTLKADSIESSVPLPPRETFPVLQPVIEEPLTRSIDLELIKAMPVRLPPIPSEELEHVDDPWLDDAYEQKLMRSGDDLLPIAVVASSLKNAVDDESSSSTQVAHSSNGNGSSAAAVARAFAEKTQTSIPKNVQLPELGDDPTEEELLAYAKAHPAVIAALKVFRGKITSVKLARD